MAISNLRLQPVQKSLPTISRPRLTAYPCVSFRQIETSKLVYSQLNLRRLSNNFALPRIPLSYNFELPSTKAMYSKSYIPDHGPQSYQDIHAAQHPPGRRYAYAKKMLRAVVFVLCSIGAIAVCLTAFFRWKLSHLRKEARKLKKYLKEIDRRLEQTRNCQYGTRASAEGTKQTSFYPF